ncbi:hypothetical protein CC78DRAFT_536334 [Lojkania enalia]|uniref:Luciferase domain-containing protein n=1 Tax=Lojkania enalia TaxID=147567 RepID=A0A9P4MWU8_9PLEO|nr:hypothetical protein CC78DRAFT_536334 [Didymosphaeria enalia]
MGFLAIMVALAVAGLVVWYDFWAWKMTGTGGTPPTWKGYWKIRRWGLWLLLHPQNLHDTSQIPSDGPSYLTTLPRRPGARPNITRWTLPQRQQREPITPPAHESLFSLMQHFATASPFAPYITSALSKTEGGTGPAIYVNRDVKSINPAAHKFFYEVAHVHPTENSLHVYCSPRDARKVLEFGWGMRFPASWLAPPSWIMVFAPRDEGEVEVVRGIVRAAVCFAVGRDVENE